MYANVQIEVILKYYITENTSVILIQAFSFTHPLSKFSVNDLVDHFSYKITTP